MKDVLEDLAPRATVSRRVWTPVEIECFSGRIWLTEQGSARDVLLEPGQSFLAERAGLLVVQALGERASFRLRSRQRESAFRRLWAALRAWRAP